MSTRTELLNSVATTIADYREGEIDPPTAEHVDTWVKQFDEAAQPPLLSELDRLLKRTYVSRTDCRKFLSGLITNKDFGSTDPVKFWRQVRFLNIQGAGNSQREMLVMFDEILQKVCALKITECGEKPITFLYLDDGIFSGYHVLNDLSGWIKTDAPGQANVRVVVIALHYGGEFNAKKGIAKVAASAGKQIEITWWRCLSIENRRTFADTSDVFWPVGLPNDADVQAYVKTLKYPPVFRKPGSIGENKFFSSEEGRNLLEQQFLQAGVRIRSQCPYLNVYQRPLGNMILETLGFGTPIVTYRNCANNCPLAFWVGDPWYPLFLRKTN